MSTSAASPHLDGKVIVVTGAGGGFGRLISQQAAARGAAIVAADVDASAAAETADLVAEAGGRAISVACDVTRHDQCVQMAAAAVEAFGAIDVLVNNAGVMPLAFWADHARALDAWDRCIDINVKGVIHGTAAVYDQMISQGRGHVVNIASIYANAPVAGAAVYGATKAAVVVLSEALRVESQGRIKVTVVRPTGVPGTGLGRGVVNAEALVGIIGQHAPRYGERMTAAMSGSMPTDMTDPESIAYWAITPAELAAAVVHTIDQPWGVVISDITVRASGEDYIL
jgi:NADP-dependent 3-hydroxy acid dehydrogenase YdfG